MGDRMLQVLTRIAIAGLVVSLLATGLGAGLGVMTVIGISEYTEDYTGNRDPVIETHFEVTPLLVIGIVSSAFFATALVPLVVLGCKRRALRGEVSETRDSFTRA